MRRPGRGDYPALASDRRAVILRNEEARKDERRSNSGYYGQESH